jgi:hypothetical protein
VRQHPARHAQHGRAGGGAREKGKKEGTNRVKGDEKAGTPGRANSMNKAGKVRPGMWGAGRAVLSSSE